VLRRFAWVLALNLIAAAVVGGSALAADDTSRGQSYTITSLADLAGADNSDATAIDERGQIVGHSGPDAVLQARGKLSDLGLPSGRTASWAFGLNERGDVVGGTHDSSGHQQAALWSNGRWTPLPNLAGGTLSEAHAVNARGQAVGYSSVGNDFTRHAVLWDTSRAPVDLGTLPGDTNSEARGINARGDIVGESYTTEGQHHAVVWRNGVISALPSLPGGGDSVAYAINARDQIVGQSGVHAALWEKRGVTDLGALPGNGASRAYGINERGQVVGSSDVAFYSHAVLWDHGAMVDLGLPPSGTQSEARGINNRGQVVGQAYDTTGHAHAVTWERARS
jgi:probable HAF family extracellular repeat protein